MRWSNCRIVVQINNRVPVQKSVFGTWTFPTSSLLGPGTQNINPKRFPFESETPGIYPTTTFLRIWQIRKSIRHDFFSDPKPRKQIPNCVLSGPDICKLKQMKMPKSENPKIRKCENTKVQKPEHPTIKTPEHPTSRSANQQNRDCQNRSDPNRFLLLSNVSSWIQSMYEFWRYYHVWHWVAA